MLDDRNRRIGKQVNGTLVRGWLYDGQRIAAEVDSASVLVSRFGYTGAGLVPEYMSRGGATYRIVTDSRGSVRLVADASTGAAAQRLDYDAFGNVTQDTSPGFQPFGFASGLYDPDTQAYAFRAANTTPPQAAGPLAIRSCSPPATRTRTRMSATIQSTASIAAASTIQACWGRSP